MLYHCAVAEMMCVTFGSSSSMSLTSSRRLWLLVSRATAVTVKRQPQDVAALMGETVLSGSREELTQSPLFASDGRMGSAKKVDSRPLNVAPLVQSDCKIIGDVNRDVADLLQSLDHLDVASTGTWVRVKDLCLTHAAEMNLRTALQVLRVLTSRRILGTLECRRLQERILPDLTALPACQIVEFLHALTVLQVDLLEDSTTSLKTIVPKLIDETSTPAMHIALLNAVVFHFPKKAEFFDQLAKKTMEMHIKDPFSRSAQVRILFGFSHYDGQLVSSVTTVRQHSSMH